MELEEERAADLGFVSAGAVLPPRPTTLLYVWRLCEQNTDEPVFWGINFHLETGSCSPLSAAVVIPSNVIALERTYLLTEVNPLM